LLLPAKSATLSAVVDLLAQHHHSSPSRSRLEEKASILLPANWPPLDVYELSGAPRGETETRIGLFVANNPMNWIDPDGLQGLPSSDSLSSNPEIVAAAEAALSGEAPLPVLSAVERELAKKAFGKGLEGSKKICDKALKDASEETLNKLADIAKNGMKKAVEQLKNGSSKESRDAARKAFETQMNRYNAAQKALGQPGL
jgi:hypothetical protein